MHPLLQPALWISEVLHGSPGPQIADILPISFIIGNIVVIGLLTRVAEARNALAVAALGLFINYVGCGLEGTGNLGDYNLALDDNVKGCPTYQQVRQPTMEGFEVAKRFGKLGKHASDTCLLTLCDVKVPPSQNSRTTLQASVLSNAS